MIGLTVILALIGLALTVATRHYRNKARWWRHEYIVLEMAFVQVMGGPNDEEPDDDPAGDEPLPPELKVFAGFLERLD